MDERLVVHVEKAIETLIDKAGEGFMDMSIDQFPSSKEIAMTAIEAVNSYKHSSNRCPPECTNRNSHVHGDPIVWLGNNTPAQNWGKSKMSDPEYKEAQKAENARLRKVVDDLPTKTSGD